MSNKRFKVLPEWVNFIATDIDGYTWGYAQRPFLSDRSWCCSGDSVSGEKCVFIGVFTELSKDWKSSLVERHK